ncbi:MAG TPA: protein kinase [Saprospiraceae bacterium]|nr:protein kinase [Saprospiraceae bacterium]
MIGQRIGNLQIIELIGEGGMGTVYRAKDIILEREVAVKVLHEHLSRDEVLLSRFKNEALLSARINHPNVATLYQFVAVDHRDYLVMEFVHGNNLEKILKQQGKLPVKIIAQILLQLAEGLQHAHAKGIIHRDIKPGNIMINHEGYVKLMDFGIARLEASARLTKMHHVIGTTHYLAPELLQGEGPSVASDLYAVGMVGYEMLYGQLPFNARSDATLVTEILHKTPSFNSKYSSSEASKLMRIIKNLLQKNPAKRFASTGTLIVELEQIARYGRIQWKDSSNHFGTGGTETSNSKEWLQKNIKGPATSLLHQLRWRSLEGKIILASLACALILLFVSLVRPKTTKEPEGELSSQMRQPASEEQISQALNSWSPATNTDQEGMTPVEASQEDKQPENPTGKEPEKPAKKPPLNANENNPPKNSAKDTKKTVDPNINQEENPVATDDHQQPEKEFPAPEEREAEQPVKEIAESQPPVKKYRSITVQIPSMEISGTFAKSISSDNSQKNQSFYLINQTPVYADGLLIIAPGARIQGIIKDAKSSRDRAKAFLAVQFNQVETVDGQWIPIQYPTYSNNGYEEIIFHEGTVVQKLKIKSRTAQLKIAE